MANGRPVNAAEAVNINSILFLDVETVPAYSDFDELPDNFKGLWRDKSRKYSSEGMPPEELFFQKAGIHAEFGKIICVSAGYFPDPLVLAPGEKSFRITSFAGSDEKEVLLKFKSLLDKSFSECKKHALCAHNGIEFDFPYISRRMMIHGIELPNLLNTSGTKAWNNPWLLDTMNMWSFGDYKDRTSLALLAACFGIPSPKDDINGKDVARVYYYEKDIDRIRIYCEKDVLSLARIFRKFSGHGPIEDSDVAYL